MRYQLRYIRVVGSDLVDRCALDAMRNIIGTFHADQIAWSESCGSGPGADFGNCAENV